MNIQYIITIIAIVAVNFCSASPCNEECFIAQAMLDEQLVSTFTNIKLCDLPPKESKELKLNWKKVSKLDFLKIITSGSLINPMSSCIILKDKTEINISYYHGNGICIEIKGGETVCLLTKEIVSKYLHPVK